MEESITIEEIIELLRLAPLRPEGGFFRQTYRLVDAEKQVVSATAIYFLLTSAPDGASKLHRLPKDEIYHFYFGDPVDMFFITPDNKPHRIALGSQLKSMQVPQVLVPAGSWQGSKLAAGGKFALLGTTMTPGFTDDDFEMADTLHLCRQFPELSKDIIAFS